MSRKRKSPPGSKKRGVTKAAGFDPFGMKPNEVQHRMENMVAVVEVEDGKENEVLYEAQRFLTEAEWDPPQRKPGNWSLMTFGGSIGEVESGPVAVCVYGLDDYTLGTLAWHLERFGQEKGWPVEDVLDYDEGQEA